MSPFFDIFESVANSPISVQSMIVDGRIFTSVFRIKELKL